MWVTVLGVSSRYVNATDRSGTLIAPFLLRTPKVNLFGPNAMSVVAIATKRFCFELVIVGDKVVGVDGGGSVSIEHAIADNILISMHVETILSTAVVIKYGMVNNTSNRIRLSQVFSSTSTCQTLMRIM